MIHIIEDTEFIDHAINEAKNAKAALQEVIGIEALVPDIAAKASARLARAYQNLGDEFMVALRDNKGLESFFVLRFTCQKLLSICENPLERYIRRRKAEEAVRTLWGLGDFHDRASEWQQQEVSDYLDRAEKVRKELDQTKSA